MMRGDRKEGGTKMKSHTSQEKRRKMCLSTEIKLILIVY